MTTKSSSVLQEFIIANLVCTEGQKPIFVTAKQNDLIVVTGNVGAGKSLFIRTLLALNPSLNGSITFNGVNVLNDAKHWRNPIVSYARQEAGFFRGTIRDNLSFDDDTITDDNMYTILADVGLVAGSKELPQGLETDIGFDGSKLSGGQRQRLALARMLCHPAQIYIVDNCDSALDPQTVLKLWKTLPKRWPAIWIIVSNNKVLLKQASDIITIERIEKLYQAT